MSLAPCIAAKGECPQNIEQLALATFGNIMAYTGDKDHPIARCVPVAMVNTRRGGLLLLRAPLDERLGRLGRVFAVLPEDLLQLALQRRARP